MTMTVKEAWQVIREAEKKLKICKTGGMSLRLGPNIEEQINRFCKILNISASKFVRICIGNSCSYWDSLPKKEFAQEILRMMKHDK